MKTSRPAFSPMDPDPTTSLPPTVSAQRPALAADKVFLVLSSPLRRSMLAYMADGQVHRVKELARAARCTQTMASKHIQVMLAAGMVGQKFGLYYLLAAFIPRAGELDFGHCLVRLPVRAVVAAG